MSSAANLFDIKSASLDLLAIVLRSTDLFGSDVVVTIEHQGAHYQLRATRQGKLILTK